MFRQCIAGDVGQDAHAGGHGHRLQMAGDDAHVVERWLFRVVLLRLPAGE